MNKRFSTLLAAALVAGGLSASAQTQALIPVGNGVASSTYSPDKYFYLKATKAGVTAGAAEYLTYLKGTVKTDSLAVVDDANLTTVEATDRALWKLVRVYDQTSGAISHWTFENKYTGTLLAEGSVNSFVWQTSTTQFGAKELTSMQGLDVSKKEKYAFRQVTTLNEKVELKNDVRTDYTTISILAKGKHSTAIELVKLDASGDIVDVWDTQEITGNQSFGGYFYAENDGTGVGGTLVSVDPGETFTISAGAKFVVNASNANDNMQVQPYVPTYLMSGIDAGQFKALISPKAYTSFKFTGLETTGANVLANNEFEFVELTVKAYETANSSTVAGTTTTATTIDVIRAKAKDAQGRDQYLRVDTAVYEGGDGYFKLKLDTLTTDASGAIVAAPKAVIQSYAFGINYAYDADSVSIYPLYNLEKDVNWSDSSTVEIKTNAATNKVVAIKQFSTAKELTIVTNAEVKANANAKYTFGDITPNGGVAEFTDGASYYVMRSNNAANDNNGKFMATDFYGEAIYADSAYYLPATQWTVKEVATGTYTIKNRETGADLVAAAGEVLYTGENGKVALNATDTVTFIAVPALANNKYLGYLNLEEEDYRNNAYSISFTDYNDITTYVNTEDSVLKASTESVYFKLAPVAEKVSSFGADTLVRNAYYISDREGKKFITYTDVNKTGYKLSETADPVKFLLRNVGENTYSLIDSVTTLADSKELIIDIKSGDVRPVEVGSAVAYNAFDILVEPAPEYVLDAKGHYNIVNLRGDMLAADSEGFGMLRKEGELKADYVADDFALWVDTATIDAIEPSYFILSGATVGENGELSGNFLRVMSDSANVEGYKAANGMTRLAFVPAKREAGVTSDSLLVNYQNETLTAKDSIGYGKKNMISDQFKFKFQYTNVEGELLAENAAGYLASYNDVLCLTNGLNKDQALVINLVETDAPTANEDAITASEVKVIAGDGVVTINGAAGKKVVVSNILGQVVANTVLTSDNATIAAPQGVVVVAVEGEEAVKAIVK